jgi:REP element-mobilizing transposase RayT
MSIYNPKSYSRKNTLRLPGYDYSLEGAYFVTICTYQRNHLFGEIALDKMILNPLGWIAKREWERTHELRPEVQLGPFVVMPNHFHALILLEPKAQDRSTTHKGTLSKLMNGYKGAVSRQAGVSVWQRGFHDHVIRNDQDYEAVYEYIETNPQRWDKDAFYTG